MSSPVPGDDVVTAIRLGFAELKAQLAEVIRRLDAQHATDADHEQRLRQLEAVPKTSDHEARIRALEERPRAMTWRELLATGLALVTLTSGVVTVIDRLTP